MTRPRAYQVNDPGTHYAKFQLPNPTSAVMNLTGPNYTAFLAATVTHTVGGVEESTPAVVIGDQAHSAPPQVGEPFHNVVAGHQFGISISGVNGGNVIPVTFQASDFVIIGGVSCLTAAKAAARINAALAAHGVTYVAATNSEGRLKVVSASGSTQLTGASATLSLTESGYTPGTLQRLGFGVVTSVTAHGKTAPYRGIVTESADGRGGYFPLRYSNGEAVLTETGELVSWSISPSPIVRMWPSIVGGQTVYGRLTAARDRRGADAATLSFFSKGYRVPPVVSNGGDFCSLTAANALTIQVDGYQNGSPYSMVVTTTFAAGYSSVADVVSALNQAWWLKTGSDRATAVSALPEPYILESETLLIYVDSATMVSCTMTAGRMSAQNVVDAINTGWTTAGGSGTIAAVVVLDGRNYVKVTSPSVSGNSSSSIQFLGSASAANKIGLPYGKVIGSSLASVHGASELKLELPFTLAATGSDSITMTVTGSADTLQKLGLSATVLNAYSYEGPAKPPAWPDMGGNVKIVMLVPEALELGDVPMAEMTILQEFMNQDTVPQMRGWAGVVNANRPIVYESGGRIPANALAGVMFDALASKSLVLGSTLSSAVVPRLNIPNAYGSLTLISESACSPSEPAFRQYGNSTDVVSDTHFTTNAKWTGSTWKKDSAGRPATRLSFGWNEDEYYLSLYRRGDDADWAGWTEELFSVARSGTVSLIGSPSTQVISWNTPLAFADHSTLVNGATEDVKKPSTSQILLTQEAQGAKMLRMSDKDATIADPAYSVTRSLNARVHVTVGDGANTFGDFNGANGLIDAITFLTTSPIIGTRRATIHLKAGYYNTGNGVNIATNSGLCDLEIVGPPGGDNTSSSGTYGRCTIGQPSINANTITFTRSGTNSGSLTLKNVMVEVKESSGTYYYGVEVVGGAHLRMENCQVQCVSINNPAAQTDNSKSKRVAVQARNCRFLGSIDTGGNGPLTFQSVAAAPETFLFEDCTFTYGTFEQRCVYIKASSSIASVVHMGALQFKNCKFNLGAGYINGGNLTVNTGVLDLDPNGQDVRAGDGLIVDSVLFENCDISATHSGASYPNVLLHLLPTANGTNGADIGAFMYIDDLRFERTRFNWVPNSGTVTNPFTVAFKGYGRTSLIGCTFNKHNSIFPASCKHGSATSDVAYAFSSTTDADWGAISISCAGMTIHDCEFNRFVLGSTTGDMNLQWRENLDASGLVFQNYDLTNESALPDKRIRLQCPVNTGVGSFSASLLGDTALVASSWGKTFVEAQGYNLTVHDTTIRNFVCPGPAAPSTYGISAIGGDSTNLTIRNSIVDYVGCPVRVLNTDGKFTMTGCTFTRCTGDTYINKAKDVTVSNCSITDCTGRVGLKIFYRDETQSIVVSNNVVKDNGGIICNSGNDKFAQIWFGSNAAGTVFPHIVAIGNDCGGYTGADKYIRVLNRHNGDEAVANGKHNTTNNLVGFETSHDFSIPTQPVYNFTDGYMMMFNLATIRNALDGAP